MAQAWTGVIDDPEVGAVPQSGWLAVPPGATTLLVLVHGLAGSVDSPYLVEAARIGDAAGFATLRLNLRGSDGSGADVYHAGLAADLHAALESPALEQFRRVGVIGYSLGGHLLARYLTEPGDERVIGGAAICAPLDLTLGAVALDSPALWPYRKYLLDRLVALYTAVATRREVPVPVARVRRVKRIREFDDLVVAPRFGFADAADYYRQMSAGPRLGSLRRPLLFVFARHDPMVPAATLEASLAPAPTWARVVWSERGGHVAFPSALDLGLGGPGGLVPQVLSWIARLG